MNYNDDSTNDYLPDYYIPLYFEVSYDSDTSSLTSPPFQELEAADLTPFHEEARLAFAQVRSAAANRLWQDNYGLTVQKIAAANKIQAWASSALNLWHQIEQVRFEEELDSDFGPFDCLSFPLEYPHHPCFICYACRGDYRVPGVCSFRDKKRKQLLES